MNDLGVLRCKYIIEQNEDLMKKVIIMAKMDGTAQWLTGDELKQDQFKFFYDVVKIIYDCALKDYMLQDDAKILDVVIPNLTAYHSLLRIKEIMETKAAEKKKEQEKLERSSKGVTFASTDGTEEEKKAAHLMTDEEIYKKRV